MPNALSVYIGTRIEERASFSNPAGVATDPDLVTFQLQSPGEVETNYVLADPEVSNPSVGLWVFSYVPTVAGSYMLRVVGSGTVDAADERPFEVLPSAFTNPA